MEYKNLGRTGLKVSVLCLGSMQFGWTADQPTSIQILDAAFSAGINFIDTADVYSRWVDGNLGGEAETIIGNWIARSSIPRHKVIIATKVRTRMGDGVNDEGLSRTHIMNAVEDSLRRLNSDYIDLYQAHSFDKNTPIEETLHTMDDLIRQGKVRYIGCSNYPSWRLMEALWTSEYHRLARFASLQPHYNLVHRAEFERELADVCRHYGLGVIPYSPLAAGFLTGKYRKDELPTSARIRSVQRHFNERNWKLLDQLRSLAQEKGNLSISQISLAWLLANPLVTSPIIGARTLDQLQDNLGAAELRLTADEMQLLDEASKWE